MTEIGRRSRLLLLAASWVAIAACKPPVLAQPTDDSSPVERLAVAELWGTTLDGERVELLPGTSRLAVLIFVAPDCPISNRYAPEITALAVDYRPRNVAFHLVYTDTSFAPEQITRHRADFLLEPQALLDRDQRLRRLTGVEVTPEVAVLDRAGALLYRGRIDDRWVDFGRFRAQARRADLRLALDAILAGEPVAERLTRAIGCYISPPPG